MNKYKEIMFSYTVALNALMCTALYLFSSDCRILHERAKFLAEGKQSSCDAAIQ